MWVLKYAVLAVILLADKNFLTAAVPIATLCPSLKRVTQGYRLSVYTVLYVTGFGYGHSVGTGNVASVASILLILVSIAVGRELQVSSLCIAWGLNTQGFI